MSMFVYLNINIYVKMRDYYRSYIKQWKKKKCNNINIKKKKK